VSATRRQFQYGYRISTFCEYVSFALLESGACKGAYDDHSLSTNVDVKNLWV
jgi:hypothetical protein